MLLKQKPPLLGGFFVRLPQLSRRRYNRGGGIMITATEQDITGMVDVIVRAEAPQAVILFGSMARGEQGPDSDVDLLVVTKQPFGPGNNRYETLKRLNYLLAPYVFPKDILAYSADEVEQWRGARNHVVASAVSEGKVLYGRV
jgi:predicted nucleotidyltransferase